MLIRMKETRRGTANGHDIRQYRENQEYVMPDTLACSFLQAGYAERITGREYSYWSPPPLSFAEEKARMREKLENNNMEMGK